MSTMKITLGAALLGLAYAAPAEAPWGGWNAWQPNSAGTGSTTSAPPPSGTAGGWGYDSGSAYSSVDLANVPIQSGNPFSFPLSDGFPNLSTQQKDTVNDLAHGTEPNGGPPTLGHNDLVSFQFIAFNEIFEVAFFTDLLFNVTNDVQGFQIADPYQKNKVIEALVAIQAQEELHADNANAILSANNVAPIQPCKYQFPTTNLSAAFELASTFTDVTLGTLQDVQLNLATDGAAAVVPIIGSVIGQEGEQNGFFRSYNGFIPSAKPFLTRSTREFAFSALNQNFVVAGSCPNSNTIPLPIFQTLNLVTPGPIQPIDQQLTFSVHADKPTQPSGTGLVFINGQNKPIVTTVVNPQNNNGEVTFEGNFPFTANVLDGFTIAVLVNSTANLNTAEDVAKVTIAGPALIEVD